MSWMLSMWVAAALLALCMGESTELEGLSLSASGYHLCIHNETKVISFLAIHKVPFTVTKPCGDWLLWKTCTVTVYEMVHQTEYKTVTEERTRCCAGYEQVGSYCALPVNRSGEFTAKPGSCPTADGLSPGSKDCKWDTDCPGWQKCCHRLGRSLCSNPASFSDYSVNGGCRFNATVTVKADYQQLMSKDGGHMNHIRLLQAMVTGALQADVSVHFLASWPVHPYRTATSLLVDCNSTLSLQNVTSRLHLLLAHIQEVSSVTVEDVNECTQPVLRRCSLQANCTNTVGSYHCACLQGYTDVDPSNPGAHCTAESTTTEPPQTYLPPMNTTYVQASSTTQDPLINSTVGFTSSSETSVRSSVESTVPTTTCSPPSITSLWSTNVTGTSFSVYWSSQLQTNQTYQVVVRRGSEVVGFHGTSQTMMNVQGLKPGVLYSVTVTPCACGSQGVTLSVTVKTDAQTLDGTARLTNVLFTADLQDIFSQASRNLTESLIDEIYQSLSVEMKALVDSGLVRIEIRGFSPGSVVVNFTLIFIPSQGQDISNVSTAVLHSLMNISKYTVDINTTSINDFDECALGDNDCSQWASCTNIWGSYTCACFDGFIDNNLQRPGRACQAIPTVASTSLSPTTFPTVKAQLITQTGDVAVTPATTTPGTTTVIVSTSKIVSTTARMSTVLSTTLDTPAATTTTSAPTTTTPAILATTPAPTATTAAPTTTSPATSATPPPPTTTTAVPTTTSPATSTTPPAPTTTTVTPSTTTSAPTTTTIAPATTTTPEPTSITTAPTTTYFASTTTSVAATTTPAPTTHTIAPATTSLASTTTSVAATTTPAPTATTSTVATATYSSTGSTSAFVITSPEPSTTSSEGTTTTPIPTSTTPVPATSTSMSSTTSVLKTAITATITSTLSSLTFTPASTTATTPPTIPISMTETITLTSSTTSPSPKITTPMPTTAPKTITSTPKTISYGPTATTLRSTTTPVIKTTPSVPPSTTHAPITATTSTTVIAASKPSQPVPKTITTTVPTTTTIATTSILTSPVSSAPKAATNAFTVGAISVQCRVAAITVTIDRNFLLSSNIRESTLYLGLPDCGVNGGNDTHAELTVAWNECVTRLVHNDTFYTASVTLFNTMDPYTSPSGAVEIPKIRLEVPIMCTYMKSMLISADFGSMGYDMIKDVITASGSFQVTVKLMNGTIPIPHNYSLSSDEALVVEVSLNTSSEQIKVIINKCWATSTQDPGDSYNHIFLENSCSMNQFTKVLVNGNSSTSRVSVKIFSIVNLNMIYLHCQVHICVQIGSNTCVPDCLQRTAQTYNTIGTAVRSSGPVLRSDEESFEEELNTLYIVGLACLGVGISLFFIFGFVCLFYYQRNRIGHYNFSVKPKQENFTYLVFNT